MEDERAAVPRPAPLPQPLSFGGVAEIGVRPLWVLLAWQCAAALGAAVALTWCVDQTWGRGLRQAAGQLPERAAIRGGRLEWPSPAGSPSPAVLFQGPLVGFVVDPAGLGESTLASDVTVVAGPDGLSFRSLFGWSHVPYPPSLDLPLGRREFTSNLVAWETPAQLALATGMGLGLLLAWWGLSLPYGLLLRMGAGLLRRSFGLGTAWRTAGAALLAPALLMTAATVLYATRNLTFVGFLLAAPLHIVAGWIYCAGGLAHLPGRQPPPSNPFGDPEPAPASAPPDANPFQSAGS